MEKDKRDRRMVRGMAGGRQAHTWVGGGGPRNGYDLSEITWLISICGLGSSTKKSISRQSE